WQEEFLQLQLYDPPTGCKVRAVNLIAPTQYSPNYYKFESTFFYFLLPKRLPHRLRNAINFVANAVFQADQRDGRLLHSSVNARSFVDITPQQPPLAEYAPLSLYSIGVIVLIVLLLQFCAIVLFVLEIVFHPMRSEELL
ncbi:hypothetical protein PENTCL1PPCAC_21665, partial [Pristionchus entomophagus]